MALERALGKRNGDVRDSSQPAMRENTRNKRIATKILFALLLAAIGYGAFHVATERRDWAISPEAKAMKNPLTSSEAALQSARAIYNERCAQCHGYKGQGDGWEAKSHGTLPADLSDPTRMAAQSDGEVFYKISAGKRPMPAFQNRLTEEQRWQLVLLVRSFAGAR
jgi:mono/diheme cytochrome c family protein